VPLVPRPEIRDELTEILRDAAGARTETGEGFPYESTAELPELARRRPFTSNGTGWSCQ
jgi:hypothetical protein